MADDKVYVSRLAHIKCSYGTKVNYLNAPTDHGIRLTSGEPVLNVNDHEPGKGKNIVHFGRCKSMTNPGNITCGISVMAGMMNPAFAVATIGANLLVEGASCCKCNPKTFEPWEHVGNDREEEDHLIEGAPALTTDHQLTCFYGGVIEITDDEVG